MGRSRSATIIVAYLMKFAQMSFMEARRKVQRKRSDININPGFTQQLHVWDIVKNNWENRETYPEYRSWKMSFAGYVLASIFPLPFENTDW